MTQPIDYPSGTVEFLTATVRADVALTQTVVMAVGDIRPTGTWVAASWVGAEWTEPDPADPTITWHYRNCRTDAPVNFATAVSSLGQHPVGVKVTDTPEIPIMLAGWVNVT